MTAIHAGRPPLLEKGKRVNVYLDEISLEKAKERGNGNISEGIRNGLKLLEEHEARVKTLQEALIAGRQSGEPRLFDNNAFLNRMHRHD